MGDNPPAPTHLQVFPPPKLTLDSSSNAEEWQMFKQQYDIYATLTELNKKDPGYQSAVFLHCIGTKGLKIFNSFEFAPAGPDNVPPAEDKNDVKLLMKKFDEYIIGEVNETYERYVFNKRDQSSGETIDDYVSTLKDLSKTCNFCDCLRDTLLRDRIVLGIQDNSTRKVLLQKRQLTVHRTIDICRGAESTKLQLKSLGSSDRESVNKVQQKMVSKDRSSRALKAKKSSAEGKSQGTSSGWSAGKEKSDYIDCKYCATSHVRNRRQCPAWEKTCKKCGGRNHFAIKCFRQRVHVVDSDSECESMGSSDDYDENVYAIKVCEESEKVNVIKKVISDKKDIYAKMLVNDQLIKFQIDCGATTNLLPLSLLPSDTILKDTQKTLHMWNNTESRPKGSCKIIVKNPMNGKKYKVEFLVVEGGLTPLLGKRTSEKMGLITVNYDSFHVAQVQDREKSILDEFPEVFNESKLGEFPGKPVHLVVKEGAIPKILPTRREPVALRGKLEKKLDEMCEMGVLAKVEIPTDWVNQMAIQMKKSGDLRICLDPRPLNEVLKKEQYTLPTLDEILPDLASAKVFTKARSC
jgi:hypothetical protein